MAKLSIKISDSNLIIKAKLKGSEQINAKEADLAAATFMHGVFRARSIKNSRIEFIAPEGISLYEYLKNPVDLQSFFSVVIQIASMAENLNMAGLPADHLVTDIEYVFISRATGELWFVYLPVTNPENSGDVMLLLRSVCYYACTNPGGAAETSYVFDSFLTSQSGFNYKEIENFIGARNPEIIRSARKKNKVRSGFITNKRKDFYSHYEKQQTGPESGTLKLLQTAGPGGKTTVLKQEEITGRLESESETVAAAKYPQSTEIIKYPTITRLKTGQEMAVDKPVYRIGKEKSYVDFFIPDNGAVSRSHADIICRRGCYYIKDLNSKNRTFIDDRALQPNIETEIHDGTAIRLANEDFIFRL